MRKITMTAGAGIFERPREIEDEVVIFDEFQVRDGNGNVVETWRVHKVLPFSKKSGHEEIEFLVEGYRDASDI